MRLGVGVWCVVAVATWSGAAHALSAQQLSELTHGRVAHLSVRDARGEEQGSGSGFVISRSGRLATNYHVVEGAGNITAVFPGKREAKVTGVWAFDKEIDLAVLQLEPGAYEPLELARQPAVEGEDIALVGSPLGLGNSIASGIVSAVRETGPDAKRYGEDVASWTLQVSVAAAPGSSGSPILRSSGDVVGILVGHLDGFDGAHFGIAVEHLRLINGSAPKQALPLSAATGVRSVRTNLMISGAVFAAAAAVWVAVSKILARRRADA